MAAAKFKWTIEMVDGLLHALGEFKADMEYRNVDFNADKAKQYEAVRKAMERKYSSGDVELFGFIVSAINRAAPHVITELKVISAHRSSPAQVIRPYVFFRF